MDTHTQTQTIKKRIFIESLNKRGMDFPQVIEFNQLLINVTSIELKSIYLYNSYYNISEALGNNNVVIKIYYKKDDQNQTRVFTENKIPDGYYNSQKFEDTLNTFLQSDSLKELRGKYRLRMHQYEETNKIRIDYFTNDDSSFVIDGVTIASKALIQLFGFVNILPITLPVISEQNTKLNPYQNYYVHCDLVENTQYKGINKGCKQSDILCILPVDETKRWWNPVTYRNVNCFFKPSKKEINLLNLWITDEEGNHIDFNDYPIIYELEIETKIEQKTPINPNVIYDTIATEICKRIKGNTNDDINDDTNDDTNLY